MWRKLQRYFTHIPLMSCFRPQHDTSIWCFFHQVLHRACPSGASSVLSLESCSFIEVHHSSRCSMTLVQTASNLHRILPQICVCVCCNANPLHYYALRVLHKADNGVKCGLFSNHHHLSRLHYVWDEYLYSVLLEVEVKVTVWATVCVVYGPLNHSHM